MSASRPDQLIAIATCSALPDGDEDGPALLAALANRAITARWVVWDDPQADWSQFELSLIRSTWDYTADREGFLRWAATVARLHNPHPVLVWNTDKSYLRDIADADLSTVPTRWVAPGGEIDWPDTEFVLKPTLGAGSKGVGRFDPTRPEGLDSAREHLTHLHDAGRTVMLQPYLVDVDVIGEAALIYFDGIYSHAITKRAMLGQAAVNPLEPGYSRSLFVPERISPRTPSVAERALGDRVIAYVEDRFGPLVYARVDLLSTRDTPVVIEVELTEPSLFLQHEPGSADRLAAVLARRLGQS